MNPAPTGLTCPKCQGSMRTYERGGVHVEQCSDCRGIFLDRGELDLLIDSEAAVYSTARVADGNWYPHAGQESRLGRHDHGYDDYSYGFRDHGYGNGYRKRREGGFLSDLFD